LRAIGTAKGEKGGGEREKGKGGGGKNRKHKGKKESKTSNTQGAKVGTRRPCVGKGEQRTKGKNL